jgi:hypothetical protein
MHALLLKYQPTQLCYRAKTRPTSHLSRPSLHTYSTLFQLRLIQARPTQPTKEIPCFFLVDTLEGRDSLALVLIQRVADYSSVGEVHLAMWLLLERQAVLHPVLVVSVGEVFSGVSTSGFLSRCCCFGRLDTDSLATASKKIPQKIWKDIRYLRASQQVP